MPKRERLAARCVALASETCLKAGWGRACRAWIVRSRLLSMAVTGYVSVFDGKTVHLCACVICNDDRLVARRRSRAGSFKGGLYPKSVPRKSRGVCWTLTKQTGLPLEVDAQLAAPEVLTVACYTRGS
uniref:Uncharacterized protein n=1 Tax=Peronospora matthiolae TaxID=2874970 RepID=A0AAV1U5R3_9STRA